MRLSLIAANAADKRTSRAIELIDIPEVHSESSDSGKHTHKSEINDNIINEGRHDEIQSSNTLPIKEDLRSLTLQKRNTLAARNSMMERTPTKQRASFDQIFTPTRGNFTTQKTMTPGGNLEQLLESPLLKRKKSMNFEKNNDPVPKTSVVSIEPIENGPPTKKTQVKSRQQKMFNEIQTNIINSNMNINDPGNFYKNWLQEIHNKQIEEKTKKNEPEKISKRLDKLQDLLKEI
jgi:hypothetical protein